MGNPNCKIVLTDDKTVTYVAPNGNKYEGVVGLDSLTRKLIERLNFLVSLDQDQEQEHYRVERVDLELLGEFLYEVLLPVGDGSDPKNLRAQIERDYASFSRDHLPNERFRVTLELNQAAKELAKYPWEFLFVRWGGKGFFLAEQSDLILTRFVPNTPPGMSIKTNEPLRILVAFSHPRELGDITSKATDEVINVILSLEDSQHIEVRVEDNPTQLQLQELMSAGDFPADAGKPAKERKRFRPDIFHFIGHGEPNRLALIRDQAAILAEEDATRKIIEAHWCPTQEVLSLFSQHTPRLVFLHACDGAKAESVNGLSDLARDLVYASVPIVIAMQYSIKNKDAALFARTFYEALRNNSEIDEAVRIGREVLGQRQDKRGSWSDRRFGTPVVYLQQDSQRAIVDFPKQPKEEEAVLYDRNAKVACPNPDCDSRVLPDWKKCLKCDHRVMMCPQCLKDTQKCCMLDISIGRCLVCDYQLGRQFTPSTPVGSIEARPSASVTEGSPSVTTVAPERVGEQETAGPARLKPREDEASTGNSSERALKREVSEK